MNKKRIGLLAALLAMATAAGISVSSCGNENGPTASSGGGVNTGKSPQMLTAGCGTYVGFDACNLGLGIVTNNDDGTIQVTGMHSNLDGVKYTFSSPIEKFNTNLDLSFPASGGTLQYQALDPNNVLQAQINFSANGQLAQTYPTFTSGTPEQPDHGFDVYIYDCNGNIVGSQLGIPAGSHVNISATSADCYNKLAKLGWGTTTINGQCVWIINFNSSGCVYTFTLPNGVQVQGCGLKFSENVTGSPYVYLGTKYIGATGTTNTYTATSSVSRPVTPSN